MEADKAEGVEASGGLGFAMLTMIDVVIQFTLLDIERVYRMAAAEFFVYVDYVRLKEQNRINEIRRMSR